jgi:hypothetical protein
VQGPVPQTLLQAVQALAYTGNVPLGRLLASEIENVKDVERGLNQGQWGDAVLGAGPGPRLPDQQGRPPAIWQPFPDLQDSGPHLRPGGMPCLNEV